MSENTPFKVILFRGRRTAQIASELEALLTYPPERVVVVASKGDRMREDSDVLPGATPYGDVLIIANGGTTAPMAAVVARLAYRAGVSSGLADEYNRDARSTEDRESPEVQIWDLQRDGADLLWAEEARGDDGYRRPRSVWIGGA